jgi:CheY-like chemotaxis protein
VVVVSALTVSPRRLREFGVTGYQPKPFAPSTLIAMVERLLAAPEPNRP